MANHIKPTQKELKETARIALEEAEKLSQLPPEEEKSEEEPEKEVVVEKEVVIEPEVEPQADPSEEAKAKLREELEQKKKEVSSSAREAQKLIAKNRIVNSAITEANTIPDPTEEELMKEFIDWDIMTDDQKIISKEVVINRNFRKRLSEGAEQASKIEIWNDTVEKYAEDPKVLIDNPELEGKVEDFKEFASKEEYNSIQFNVLISAFLHEQSKNKVEHKGSQFLTGSGGHNDPIKPKSDKISIDDARVLRNTDYTKYKELLRAGKIKLDEF